MELEVHRLRIGNVKPSPVTTLASDFPSSSKVAVGRENGTIEIMDSGSNFAVLCRIAGYDTFELQALQWSRASTESDIIQSRLFGLSRRGFLFEIDFNRGMICSNLIDCYSSAAWCMSGCPRRDELAIGGEDGAVKIFTYETENRLEYLKTLPTTGSRILALCYHPIKGLLVVGGEDGIIRGLSEINGRHIFRLTSHATSASIPPAITCLLCLPDSSINEMVSGDHTGRLRVWDLDKQVSMSEFNSSDAGSVKCLASATNAVFAGMQDGRVLCLSRSSPQTQQQHGQSTAAAVSWGYSHSQRIGVHSTTALLSSPSSSSSSALLGLLLAGSEDGRLYMLGNATDTFHRYRPKDLSWLAPASSSSSSSSVVSVVLEGDKKVIIAALLQDRGINIWITPFKGQQPRLALTLTLKSEAHVRAVSLLAVSDQQAVYLFAVGGDGALKAWRLQITLKGASSVQAVKMAIPDICQAPIASLSPVLACISSSEGQGQVACYDGLKHNLILLSINTTENDLTVDSIIACDMRGSDTQSRPGIGSMNKVDYRIDNHIAHLCYSTEARYLAMASITGSVTSIDVNEKKVHWRLRNNNPSSSSSSPVPAMRFVNDSILILLTSSTDGSGKIATYDVSTMSLLKCWSTSGAQAETVIPHSLRHALVGMTVLPSDADSNTAPEEAVDTKNNKQQLKKKARRGRNSLPTIDEETECNTSSAPALASSNRGKGKGKVVVYSSTQAVFIDLAQPLPAQAKAVGPFSSPLTTATATAAGGNDQPGQGQNFETARQRKRRVRFETNNSNNDYTRKRKASEGNLDQDTGTAGDDSAGSSSIGNFCLVDLYRDVLHMSFLPPPADKADARPQLVVIESPWSRVAETLPDVLDRKRYGT